MLFKWADTTDLKKLYEMLNDELAKRKKQELKNDTVTLEEMNKEMGWQ